MDQVGQPDEGIEFVEALARGCEVMKMFGDTPELALSDVAARTGLTRQTVRRVLITLEELGYARRTERGYTLTAQTLELGTESVSARDKWDLSRPHLAHLVERTAESCSIGTMAGSDVVYMERVAVPKVISLAVRTGTRLPATSTSIGHVILADLTREERAQVLAKPSTSGVMPRSTPSGSDLDVMLDAAKERGWAISDQLLAVGVRSLAAPLRDSNGHVVAAIETTVHASETSVDALVNEHLPLLLHAADAVMADWHHLALLPSSEIPVA